MPKSNSFRRRHNSSDSFTSGSSSAKYHKFNFYCFNKEKQVILKNAKSRKSNVLLDIPPCSTERKAYLCPEASKLVTVRNKRAADADVYMSIVEDNSGSERYRPGCPHCSNVAKGIKAGQLSVEAKASRDTKYLTGLLPFAIVFDEAKTSILFSDFLNFRILVTSVINSENTEDCYAIDLNNVWEVSIQSFLSKQDFNTEEGRMLFLNLITSCNTKGPDSNLLERSLPTELGSYKYAKENCHDRTGNQPNVGYIAFKQLNNVQKLTKAVVNECANSHTFPAVGSYTGSSAQKGFVSIYKEDLKSKPDYIRRLNNLVRKQTSTSTIGSWIDEVFELASVARSNKMSLSTTKSSSLIQDQLALSCSNMQTPRRDTSRTRNQSGSRSRHCSSTPKVDTLVRFTEKDSIIQCPSNQSCNASITPLDVSGESAGPGHSDDLGFKVNLLSDKLITNFGLDDEMVENRLRNLSGLDIQSIDDADNAGDKIRNLNSHQGIPSSTIKIKLPGILTRPLSELLAQMGLDVQKFHGFQGRLNFQNTNGIYSARPEYMFNQDELESLKSINIGPELEELSEDEGNTTMRFKPGGTYQNVTRGRRGKNTNKPFITLPDPNATLTEDNPDPSVSFSNVTLGTHANSLHQADNLNNKDLSQGNFGVNTTSFLKTGYDKVKDKVINTVQTGVGLVDAGRKILGRISPVMPHLPDIDDSLQSINDTNELIQQAPPETNPGNNSEHPESVASINTFNLHTTSKNRESGITDNPQNNNSQSQIPLDQGQNQHSFSNGTGHGPNQNDPKHSTRIQNRTGQDHQGSNPDDMLSHVSSNSTFQNGTTPNSTKRIFPMRRPGREKDTSNYSFEQISIGNLYSTPLDIHLPSLCYIQNLTSHQRPEEETEWAYQMQRIINKHNHGLTDQDNDDARVLWIWDLHSEFFSAWFRLRGIVSSPSRNERFEEVKAVMRMVNLLAFAGIEMPVKADQSKTINSAETTATLVIAFALTSQLTVEIPSRNVRASFLQLLQETSAPLITTLSKVFKFGLRPGVLEKLYTSKSPKCKFTSEQMKLYFKGYRGSSSFTGRGDRHPFLEPADFHKWSDFLSKTLEKLLHIDFDRAELPVVKSGKTKKFSAFVNSVIRFSARSANKIGAKYTVSARVLDTVFGQVEGSKVDEDELVLLQHYFNSIIGGKSRNELKRSKIDRIAVLNNHHRLLGQDTNSVNNVEVESKGKATLDSEHSAKADLLNAQEKQANLTKFSELHNERSAVKHSKNRLRDKTNFASGETMKRCNEFVNAHVENNRRFRNVDDTSDVQIETTSRNDEFSNHSRKTLSSHAHPKNSSSNNSKKKEKARKSKKKKSRKKHDMSASDSSSSSSSDEDDQFHGSSTGSTSESEFSDHVSERSGSSNKKAKKKNKKKIDKLAKRWKNQGLSPYDINLRLYNLEFEERCKKSSASTNKNKKDQAAHHRLNHSISIHDITTAGTDDPEIYATSNIVGCFVRGVRGSIMQPRKDIVLLNGLSLIGKSHKLMATINKNSEFSKTLSKVEKWEPKTGPWVVHLLKTTIPEIVSSLMEDGRKYTPSSPLAYLDNIRKYIIQTIPNSRRAMMGINTGTRVFDQGFLFEQDSILGIIEQYSRLIDLPLGKVKFSTTTILNQSLKQGDDEEIIQFLNRAVALAKCSIGLEVPYVDANFSPDQHNKWCLSVIYGLKDRVIREHAEEKYANNIRATDHVAVTFTFLIKDLYVMATIRDDLEHASKSKYRRDKARNEDYGRNSRDDNSKNSSKVKYKPKGSGTSVRRIGSSDESDAENNQEDTFNTDFAHVLGINKPDEKKRSSKLKVLATLNLDKNTIVLSPRNENFGKEYLQKQGVSTFNDKLEFCDITDTTSSILLIKANNTHQCTYCNSSLDHTLVKCPELCADVMRKFQNDFRTNLDAEDNDSVEEGQATPESDHDSGNDHDVPTHIQNAENDEIEFEMLGENGGSD